MIPNVKITVIDDDEALREFVVDVLEYSVNRKVQSFNNGLDAWNYVDVENEKKADLLVCDVDMPKLNGLELLSRVKRKYPKINFVIMTGNPSHEKAAKELGADAFLAKPFALNDLFNIVQNFVVN